VIAFSPDGPSSGSPYALDMSSGGRKVGSCSPASIIQSWSRKKCIRPDRVCQGFSRSVLIVKAA